MCAPVYFVKQQRKKVKTKKIISKQLKVLSKWQKALQLILQVNCFIVLLSCCFGDVYSLRRIPPFDRGQWRHEGVASPESHTLVCNFVVLSARFSLISDIFSNNELMLGIAVFKTLITERICSKSDQI